MSHSKLISVRSQVNVEYLVEQIVGSITRDELINLIKFIDIELVQDADFTNELFMYFKAEMEKELGREL